MDWLKSILNSLPLEKFSDILGEIVIWWSQMVSGVSPDNLPMYAYLGGAIIVLVLWLLVARMLPRPFGGMSWMILFAVLLAPGTALSDPSTIAPASISVVYAIMMKDTAGAISNALPVLVVLVVGLFIGFVWQLIRGAFESSLDKARQLTAADTRANMQLAGGNYLAQDTLTEEKPVENKEPLPLAVSKESSAKNKTVEATTSTVPKSFAPENIAPKNTTAETDISLKKDQGLKRKPVEGFYSKKMTKEPVVIVEKNSEDDK